MTQESYWNNNGNVKQKTQEPFQKRVKTQTVIRWSIRENRNLPLFSTEEGQALIQRVVEWAKPENRGTDSAGIHQTEN